jgi:hypothetical protein
MFRVAQHDKLDEHLFFLISRDVSGNASTDFRRPVKAPLISGELPKAEGSVDVADRGVGTAANAFKKNKN